METSSADPRGVPRGPERAGRQKRPLFRSVQEDLLQVFAGVRSGRFFLVVDVGRYRKAVEQRVLDRVIIIQLDPHGQTLHDLHEIARGVFRRQERQRGAGAHLEARDVALELLVTAVHIDVQVDGLADPEGGQLRLFEVGVDPDFRQRAHGHQALPGGDVVAGIDVAARDRAVDLRVDGAVAEVQFGLVQIGAGLVQLRLRIFYLRRVFGHLRQDGVDVTLGMALVEIGQQRLRREVERRGDNPQRGRGLLQGGHCLAHRGKILVQLGRHLGQVALLGLGLQSQTDANLVNLLQCQFDLRLGHEVGRFVRVDVLLADHARLLLQLDRPFVVRIGERELGLGRLPRGDVGLQQRNLVVHVFNRVIHLEAGRPRCRDHRANVVLGDRQVRLGQVVGRALGIDNNLVRLRIQPHQHIPLADPVVVVHQHFQNVARHTRGDQSKVAVDVGVVGGDGVQGAIHNRDAKVCGQGEHHDDDGDDDDAAPADSLMRDGRLRRRGAGRTCGVRRRRAVGR